MKKCRYCKSEIYKDAKICPNGTGTVQYLGDRRSKPFQAVVTIGRKENGMPLRKSLGCEEDYWKAYDLLVKYQEENYDVDVSSKNIKNI